MSPARLPQQSTPFIGRDLELGEIADLLADPACRLLSLVGPGGMGKTRLAVQAAERQEIQFANGVVFVALDMLESADFLPAAVLGALEIPFLGAEEPFSRLMGYLRGRQVLLVLDNFEQLSEGAACLAELLQAAPGLKILATSRERLNLREEWVFTLDGLSYPPEHFADAAENYSAVQLFVQRARQVQHRFALKDQLLSVLSICRQVEGMPLGLELAASWLGVMSCEQIAAQMLKSLDFLTTPLRNIPERHRSLRMLFEQSWNLLPADQQAVLMRLSVFRGGFDFEAAAEVAGAAPAALAGLLGKSLLRLDGAGRYHLHELLRQFAGEKLAGAGETGSTRRQHLAFYRKLAEAGEAHAYGREQVAWYDRLEVEMDNLRAALACSLSSGEVEPGLRTAAALRWVWEMRGHLNEGLDWFHKLLQAGRNAPPAVRSKALHRASELAAQVGDEPQAAVWVQEALRLARSTDDRWNAAWSLSAAGFFTEKNNDRRAAMLEESLGYFRELSDPFGLSHTLRRLAGCALDQHKDAYAAELLEQALAGDRQAGDRNAAAWELCFLGVALWSRYHRPGQVIPLYQESIALFQELKDVRGAAHPLTMLADVERADGNLARSQALYQETLRMERELGICDNLALTAIAGIAGLAAAQGKPLEAAKLLAAVQSALESGSYNTRLFPLDNAFESTLAGLRAQLAEPAFSAAWTAGTAMPLERALLFALEGEFSPAARQEIRQALPEPLSPRELDVIRLLGAGLSNAEIGQKLFISTATVKVHARSIYAKLNVRNRAQAILQAQKLNLI